MVQAQNNPGSASQPVDQNGDNDGDDFGDKFKAFAFTYRTPISSGTASMISTFCAFPLDFAKSRMQSYGSRFLPTIQDAYRSEGIRGFWRGVTPPLVSVTAVRTTSFSLYQAAKTNYSGFFHNLTGEGPVDISNGRNLNPTLATIICFASAGATAGATVTVLACPFELTKLHSQLAGKIAREQGKKEVRMGALGTAQKLFREHGFRGLYIGYRLHLLRDTIGTSIYFTTYETAKLVLGNVGGVSSTSPLAVMIGGGLCGMLSWCFTYPIDVAKTVYQKSLMTDPKTKIPFPKIRFFQPGSYRGLGVSVARSCLINMIFFSMFERIKGYIVTATI